MTDIDFMQRAISLARLGWYSTMPNPRVGCVIVKNKQIIGEGWHQQAGGAHAEIHALKAAASEALGATAYVTLEPCSHFGRTPPCAQALIDAGIKRLVIGTLDVNTKVAGSGASLCRDAGIEVESSVLENEAQALNPGFAMRMQQGRPRLTCKLAMSVDGRTAMASGESQWITGAAARSDVQKLRARSCAVISGAGTVLADNPAFTVRPKQWDEPLPFGVGQRQPMRVIFDRKASCSGGEAVFNKDAESLLVCGKGVVPLFTVDYLDCADDIALLLQELGRRECNEVLLECGPKLAGVFLQQGFIDELIIYMAPKLMGSAAKPLFELPLDLMKDSIDLQINDIRAIGNDWRLSISPKVNP